MELLNWNFVSVPSDSDFASFIIRNCCVYLVKKINLFTVIYDNICNWQTGFPCQL